MGAVGATSFFGWLPALRARPKAQVAPPRTAPSGSPAA